MNASSGAELALQKPLAITMLRLERVLMNAPCDIGFNARWKLRFEERTAWNTAQVNNNELKNKQIRTKLPRIFNLSVQIGNFIFKSLLLTQAGLTTRENIHSPKIEGLHQDANNEIYGFLGIISSHNSSTQISQNYSELVHM